MRIQHLRTARNALSELISWSLSFYREWRVQQWRWLTYVRKVSQLLTNYTRRARMATCEKLTLSLI